MKSRSLFAGSMFSASLFSLGLLGSALLPTQSWAAPNSFETGMNDYLQKDENVKKLADALEQHFMKRQAEAQQKQQMAAKNRLEEQFKNPVKIEIGRSPVKGPENAKITIVEFSDFECPFCQKGADNLEKVLSEYPGQIKVVFKNLPLPFHEKARPAAIAALAAHKQGKFWEMYDLLFQNQEQLSPEFFEATAQKLNLDMAKFKADLADSKELSAQIDEDVNLASKVGVSGTPGFFINGVLLSGAQPVQAFKNIIDRHLGLDKK